MPATKTFIMPLGADLRPQVSPNSPKRIWVVNPFDELPNESDVPLRYWALCRTFAEQGHEVIWWSSDFSHLTKSRRQPCPDTDGFSVRLVETPPYAKNISCARLKNHKAFANGFYRDAMEGLKSGELNAPDRIVVSLPPLGVAEQAFRIRDALRKCKSGKVGTYEGQYQGRSRVALAPDSNEEKDTANWPLKQPEGHTQPSDTITSPCEVCVDIMDAWPETFYQALPKPLRNPLGPILLAPMHRSAKRAYQGADKISAVGQSYLDLAAQYLGQRTDSPQQAPLLDEEGWPKGRVVPDPQSAINHPRSKTLKPMFLCYHGTDLSRFIKQKPEGSSQRTSNKRSRVASAPDSVPTSTPLSSQPSALKSLPSPLRAVYLGSMGQGYDLETIIEVAARWKTENIFPFQIHFAGEGTQFEKLKAESRKLKLIDSERIVFHGQLGRDAVNALLLSADLALVPNRPDSLVACPYKAGEYAAAGLPMISCLGGELGGLLNQWNAGTEYNEGDAASLQAASEGYSDNLDLLKQHSLNAKNMAEELFDREISYQKLAEFIVSPQI